MFSFTLFLFFSVLARQALAVFNVSVIGANLTASQFFNFPASAVTSNCIRNCSLANSTLNGCNNDPNCLCDSTAVAHLRDCEQCLFTRLVETNQKADFLVGSQAVLNGLATACQTAINITLSAPQTALTLPSTWNGPFDAVLPTGGVVAAVGSAVVLGVSALFILSNL